MLSDGTRGPEMNNIAAGEGVEVVLEEGRFLPGVVEAVVGKKAGDSVRCLMILLDFGWFCWVWVFLWVDERGGGSIPSLT